MVLTFGVRAMGAELAMRSAITMVCPKALPKDTTKDIMRDRQRAMEMAKRLATIRAITRDSRMLINHINPVSKLGRKKDITRAIIRAGILDGATVGGKVGGWVAPIAGSTAARW